MSNTTTGRIPLWFVGTVAGIAALGLLTIFFYGFRVLGYMWPCNYM